MVGGVWRGLGSCRCFRYIEWRTSAPGSFNIFLFLPHSLSLSLSPSLSRLVTDACRVLHDEECSMPKMPNRFRKPKNFLILSNVAKFFSCTAGWWLEIIHHGAQTDKGWMNLFLHPFAVVTREHPMIHNMQ